MTDHNNSPKIFYCLTCCTRRHGIIVDFVRMENGNLALKAICEVDGTEMFRIAKPDELDVEFHSINPSENVLQACKNINQQIAAYFANHPQELYEVSPKYFETLIAEILSSFGFELQVNVRLLGDSTGDEADIIAFRSVNGMSKNIGYVIECKRYKEKRKVDLQIATHLYGLKQRYSEKWGLDHALLVTTSTVTDQVRKVYGSRWDFEIADFSKLVEWLKIYSCAPENMIGRHQDLYEPITDVVISIAEYICGKGELHNNPESKKLIDKILGHKVV